jgi:hypothetical protein
MKALGFFIAFTLSYSSMAQSIEQFQWKKRILIISGDEKTVASFYDQYKDTVGIQDRKLTFFKAITNKLEPLETDQKAQYVLPAFIKTPFKFYLIGLDGSLKLKSEKVVSQERLFKLIDSMPMRASEIRRKHE